MSPKGRGSRSFCPSVRHRVEGDTIPDSLHLGFSRSAVYSTGSNQTCQWSLRSRNNHKKLSLFWCLLLGWQVLWLTCLKQTTCYNLFKAVRQFPIIKKPPIKIVNLWNINPVWSVLFFNKYIFNTTHFPVWSILIMGKRFFVDIFEDIKKKKLKVSSLL